MAKFLYCVLGSVAELHHFDKVPDWALGLARKNDVALVSTTFARITVYSRKKKNIFMRLRLKLETWVGSGPALAMQTLLFICFQLWCFCFKDERKQQCGLIFISLSAKPLQNNIGTGIDKVWKKNWKKPP
jgi:hypothetical protein